MRSRTHRHLGKVLGALALASAALGQPRAAAAGWWDENVETHGFLRSTAHVNSANFDFGRGVALNSLRSELNLETQVKVYDGEKLNLELFSVLRPNYDAVYDIYPHKFGKRAEAGAPGTQIGANLIGAQVPANFNVSDGSSGKSFPGAGGGIDGTFNYISGDVQFLFTNKVSPFLSIDNTVFYGNVAAPASPRSGNQPKLGGIPNLDAFTHGNIGFGLGTPPNTVFPALAGSIAAAQTAGRSFFAPLVSPQQTRILGRKDTFDQLPFDVNATEGKLKTDCFDNAHPECFLRELYLEANYGSTQIRAGKQQIVWGKTDAFRLQDIVNPQDLGQRSIFDSLEDRRIPTLALDVVQTFGKVGPLEDFSAEFAWVVDKFSPVQLGQCGDSQPFHLACEGRADVAAHGTVGFSTAGVKKRAWNLRNTEPGVRFEFRIPDPSISFSLSGFYGFQDEPAPRLQNQYSISNPNPGGLLFLQKLGVADQIAATLNGIAPGLANTLAPRFTGGFDPYNPAQVLATGNEVAGLYGLFFGPGGVLCPDTGSAGAKAQCITASGAQILNFPFEGGETVLEYPRVFTLGGSADYQIPGADGILRVETAYDFGRHIADSSRIDLNSKSDVARAAVGVDFNPFIPFISRSRTSFVSAQIFAEYIVSYDDKGSRGRMIPNQTQVITTFFMQNFFRNDSVTLTNFAAYDWSAGAVATGPSIKWILTNSVFVEFGANVVWGQRRKDPLRNLCATGTLTESCLGSIANQQAGAFQGINSNFAGRAESPFFTEGFGDNLQERKDELFFGLTYQF